MFTSCRGQLPSGSQDLQLLQDEGCFSLKSCLLDGAVEVSIWGGGGQLVKSFHLDM